MRYRDDPRWKEARAGYLAEGSPLGPDDLFAQRIDAAWRMREIEREHEAAQRNKTA